MTTLDGTRAGARVTWARVEEGFHVGSRDGEFLGYVDRQRDGQYLACDMFSREVGVFTEITAAMTAVSAATDTAHPTVQP